MHYIAFVGFIINILLVIYIVYIDIAVIIIYHRFRFESKLDDFHKALSDISEAQERFKRNSELENRVRTKRQVQSNVRFGNNTINKSNRSKNKEIHVGSQFGIQESIA